jgi:hypothetical protein
MMYGRFIQLIPLYWQECIGKSSLKRRRTLGFAIRNFKPLLARACVQILMKFRKRTRRIVLCRTRKFACGFSSWDMWQQFWRCY